MSDNFPAHSIWQKNYRPISSTIKTQNFKIKLAWFLPNSFAVRQTTCAKKKLLISFAQTNVDEIDPRWKIQIRLTNTVKLGYNEQLGTSQICSL